MHLNLKPFFLHYMGGNHQHLLNGSIASKTVVVSICFGNGNWTKNTI